MHGAWVCECELEARACVRLVARAFTEPDEHSVHDPIDITLFDITLLLQDADEDESVIDYERYEQL